MDDRRIEYTSPNGYRGVLYGKSSLSIYNPDGTESLHTGLRTINTYEELKNAVDEHPQFMKMLEGLWKADPKGGGSRWR